jgi:hypothetical protein
MNILKLLKEPTDEMVDAPRSFILYCETQGRTWEGARRHMKRSGDSIDSWPAWAQQATGHITKGGMAQVIFAMMVAAMPEAATVPYKVLNSRSIDRHLGR